MSVAAVRTWLRDVVVGLNLCPFAATPLRAGRVRLAVSEASDLGAALMDLAREADALHAGEADTTLLLLPGAPDFETFVAWTEDGEDLLVEDGLQVVPFHPDFRFADSDPSDPANAVNRSPVALWHLLQAEQVAAVIEAHPDIASIPERNAQVLRELAAGGEWSGS